MAGARFYHEGRIQLEKVEDPPETVVPHIRQRSSPKFIPATKNRVSVVWMIGPVERRSEPELPIKTGRHGRRVGGNGGVLRPHRAVGPVVNLPQRPNRPFIDPALNFANVSAIAGRQKMRCDFGFSLYLDDYTNLVYPICLKFLQ